MILTLCDTKCFVLILYFQFVLNLKLIAMKENILGNLDNPEQLELLYRTNKVMFKKAFNLIYPEIESSAIAQVWYQR